MSPWWLRPPADEPVGDESSTSPVQDGGSQGETAVDGAGIDFRQPESTPPVPPEAPLSDRANQMGHKPSRRRSRRGQPGRARREGGDATEAPTSSRPSGRDRRGSAARKGGGQEAAVGASSGIREATGTAARAKDRPALEDRRLAVICDLENITLGVREAGVGQFEIGLVVERLLDKGKIIIKRAYADWDRHGDGKQSYRKVGMELVDIPPPQQSGKSGADIRIAVDAMELCYSKQHLDTFVLISGDGDLTPLVFKLKANNKHVIGVGSLASSSQVLIDNCDEFLFYEDVLRDAQEPPRLGAVDEERVEVFTMLVEAIQALMRENQQILWGSVIKQAIQRKHPTFNESHYGCSSFSKLLEEAERAGVIRLRKDQRSGSYVVTGFART